MSFSLGFVYVIVEVTLKLCSADIFQKIECMGTFLRQDFDLHMFQGIRRALFHVILSCVAFVYIFMSLLICKLTNKSQIIYKFFIFHLLHKIWIIKMERNW